MKLSILQIIIVLQSISTRHQATMQILQTLAVVMSYTMLI